MENEILTISLTKIKNEIKESKFSIIFACFYGVYIFILLFIRTTINSVYEADVLNFTHPFSIALNLTFLLLGFTIIIGLIKNKKSRRLIRISAIVNIVICLMISLLSMLPDYYKHLETITLNEKLLKSFLSISFSLTSWLNIFILIGISLLMIGSTFINWKNQMGNRMKR